MLLDNPNLHRERAPARKLDFESGAHTSRNAHRIGKYRVERVNDSVDLSENRRRAGKKDAKRPAISVVHGGIGLLPNLVIHGNTSLPESLDRLKSKVRSQGAREHRVSAVPLRPYGRWLGGVAWPAESRARRQSITS